MKSLANYLSAALLLLFFITACDSQWEDHTKTNELRGKSLMEIISSNPETSVFASILQKTGYDVLLSGDKMMTVFAPINSALSGLDMNNTDALRNLVKNHLAYANYTVTNGSFDKERIMMLNDKYSNIEKTKINGVSIVEEAGKYNLTVGNGILHLVSGAIPSQKNVFEYLQSESGNLQSDFIQKQNRMIMDMEKSIQIGVTPSGKPLYDTIWRNENPFLQRFPLNDEAQKFTYILLPNSVVQRIENKYAKYFANNNSVKQDSIVRAELISDCILAPVVITADGRYASLGNVLMDIRTANIKEKYEASNGIVYKLDDAEVKIYENKVKTLKIEGENYFSFYADNMNAWMMRERPGLSGGRDMVLNSPTTYNTTYKYEDADTTINIAITRTFSPRDATYNAGRTNNCYIEYRPVINSVEYKIYWSGYNDYPAHIKLPIVLSVNTGKQTVTVNTNITCKSSQKMLISLPELPRVNRLSTNGNFVNNFSPNHLFTSSRFIAGVHEEKQLFKSPINTDVTLLPFVMPTKNTSYTEEENFFTYFEGEDKYGDKATIINSTYGVATVLISNTAENRATNSGMVFLDYFKLVPVVDPNE